jgi:hypothetical protein
MALFEVSENQLREVSSISLVAERVRERQQLQQWLVETPMALGEDLFIVAEEFGDWEDSRRRIDLLALDREGNLVVIELKRTDDGGHMDLQAIRYAAMISSMRFDDVVRAHQTFMTKRGIAGDARERIAGFLEVPISEPGEISNVPRIVLVARDFSIEITTTVLWLVERGIDIRCVRIDLYRVGDRHLVDFQQVLPLEEASEYQVRIRQKDEIVRRTSVGKQRERTLSALSREGLIKHGTEIEIVPSALPPDAARRDSRTFRARVVDPESRESVEWLLDGQRYSASRLSHLLRDQHGVVWITNNVFVHWRIVGDKGSMWDRAEALTRGERFVHSDDSG